jgi:hypothetical protein
MINQLHHYNTDHLPASALEVVPLILEIFKPVSIIDVGCGLGQWLKVFEEHGIGNIKGIDGVHVLKEKMFIDRKKFQVVDLENCHNFQVIEKFGLVLSLEVAEHISNAKSDEYISLITKLGDRILFSAAIPNQTGENHINEQPHIFWQEKFRKLGWEMLDVFRPSIWNNEKINWWYRQNLFLVVKPDDHLFRESDVFDGRQLIHPNLFQMYVHFLNEKKNKVNKYQAINLKSLKKIKRIILKYISGIINIRF